MLVNSCNSTLNPQLQDLLFYKQRVITHLGLKNIINILVFTITDDGVGTGASVVIEMPRPPAQDTPLDRGMRGARSEEEEELGV